MMITSRSFNNDYGEINNLFFDWNALNVIIEWWYKYVLFNTEAGSVMFDIILIRQYKQQPYQQTEMVVSNKNATIPTRQGSPHTEKSITTMKGHMIPTWSVIIDCYEINNLSFYWIGFNTTVELWYYYEWFNNILPYNILPNDLFYNPTCIPD